MVRRKSRGTIALDAGVHPFKLRYEQAGGGFALAVRYARAGRRMMDIPASRLLPDAMSYTEYRLRRAIPLGGAALAVLLWMAATRTSWRGAARLRASAVSAAVRLAEARSAEVLRSRSSSSSVSPFASS